MQVSLLKPMQTMLSAHSANVVHASCSALPAHSNYTPSASTTPRRHQPHPVSINHTPSASTTPCQHQPHPVSINHTLSVSTTPRQHQPHPVSINHTLSASTTPCQHQRYPMVIKHQPHPMVIKHQPYPVSIKLTARSILAGHVTGRAQTHAVVDGDADAAVSGRGSDG